MLSPSERSALRANWSSATMVEVLKHWAEKNGDKEVFCFHQSAPSLAVGSHGNNTQTRTYAELDKTANLIARGLQKMWLSKQDRVLLVFPAGLEFIDALMGCMYAAAVAVPTPPPSSKRRRASASRFSAVVSNCQPAAILTTSTYYEAVKLMVEELYDDSPYEPPQIKTLEAIKEYGEGLVRGVKATSTDLCLIQYTSGSTGDPKGVMLSYQNVLANLKSIGEKFKTTEQCRGFFWLPPHHDMGLIGAILETIYMGGFTGLMDPSLFISNPLNWLEGISLHRATISGAPNFAYDLCSGKAAKQAIEHLNLLHWRVVFSGAEPVQATTIQTFSKTFSRCGFDRRNWMPCYGLAESTLMVTCTESGTASISEHFSRQGIEDGKLQATKHKNPASVNLVSAGTIIADHTLRIIDPHSGGECEDGEIGEIHIAGPSVSEGYWGRNKSSEEDQASEQSAGDFLDHSDSKLLSTGDLGALVGSHLYLTGRLADLIIIRGRNLFPTDLELVVQRACPAIEVNGCAAFSTSSLTGATEKLVLACEVRREARHNLDKEMTVAAIREALILSHQVNPDQVILLRPGALPRTTSGKIRRSSCREALLKKLWSPIHTASVQNLPDERGHKLIPDDQKRSHLLRLIETNNVKAIDPSVRLKLITDYLEDFLSSIAPNSGDERHLSSKSLAALGLDSISQIQLAANVEEDLHISLGTKPLDPNQTILEVAHQINAQFERLKHSAEIHPTGRPYSAGDTVPMSPIQREYLTPDIKNAGGFSVTTHIRTPAGTNSELVNKALTKTLGRHDAFALRYKFQNGCWCQTYRPELSRVEYETRQVTTSSRTAWRELGIELERWLGQKFDLDTGPLARAVFVDRGQAERGVLSVSAHHLIVDAISMRTLVREFEKTYAGLLRGSTEEISFPKCRYLEWIDFHADRARTLDMPDHWLFWERQLRGCADPAENVRDHADLHGVNVCEAETDVDVSHCEEIDGPASTAILAQLNTSRLRHDAILAAVLRNAAPMLRKEELVVRLRHHGRFTYGDNPTAATVGWLTHHFPLALKASGQTPLRGIMAEAAVKLGDVPDYGISFGWLYHLSPNRDTSSTLKNGKSCDVFFSFLDDVRIGAGMSGRFRILETVVRHQYSNQSFYPEPLIVHSEVHDKCIQITIRSNGHFSEDDIRDLARKISNDLRDVEQLGGS